MDPKYLTPRTDTAAEVRIVKCRPREIVDADFARDLERELEDLRAAVGDFLSSRTRTHLYRLQAKHDTPITKDE